MKNTRFLALLTLFVAAVGVRVSGQAPRDGMVVSTAWLAEHASDANLVLLHLGVKAEYDTGHIPGARFVTFSDISVSDPAALTLQMPAPDDLRARLEKLGISDQSRVIVSYGKDRISQATRVLFTLDYAGLGRRASLLDGGYEAWLRDGRRITAEVPTVTPGKLSPLAVRTATIVDAPFVSGKLNTAGTVVIDGRLPGFYNGTQTGGQPPNQHRTGHIAGAKNIPYTETVDANGMLKSPDELKTLFTAAGVKPTDNLIVYCHIGQQATAVIFAARTLGLNVALYDGSFEDWSKWPELPVTNPSKK